MTSRHNNIDSTVPHNSFTTLNVRKPSKRTVPNPPALIVAAMVAMPIVEVAAIRIPAIMDDIANGSWIFLNI